jgi:hypothetical protein
MAALIERAGQTDPWLHRKQPNPPCHAILSLEPLRERFTPPAVVIRIRDAVRPKWVWPRLEDRAEAGCPQGLTRSAFNLGSRTPGPRGRMWSASIVVAHPRRQDSSQVSFAQWNDPIEALTTQSPDWPFAERVRLRAAHRRSAHLEAEVRKRNVQLGEKDRKRHYSGLRSPDLRRCITCFGF